MLSARPDEKRFRRSRALALEWEDRQGIFVVCGTGLRLPADLAVLALVTRLDGWTTRSELAAEGIEVSLESLETLARFGLLEVEGDAHVAEPSWHPFDLDVQRTQSRGASARRAEPPPSPFGPRREGTPIPLPTGPTPPLPLVEAIARRRSIRSYRDVPPTLEVLGTLLHHAARVRATAMDAQLGEVVFRPYPSAGARSELGLYVVATSVEGLVPGAYYFEARDHSLIPIPTTQVGRVALGAWIYEAIGRPTGPAPGAVLVFTAVFERLFWKYGRFGLTLAYQDLGCLVQTLYLVATALGLGVCAIGAGRSEETSHLLGLDEIIETTIGYMALGVPAN